MMLGGLFPKRIGEKERHMRTMVIAAMAALLVSNPWTLQVVGGVQTENTPANETRKEQSKMTDEKVIMLIEAKIQPQHRAELIEALHEYLPLVRAEREVEAFYVTARKDDPYPLRKCLAVSRSALSDSRLITNMIRPKDRMGNNCPLVSAILWYRSESSPRNES